MILLLISVLSINLFAQTSATTQKWQLPPLNLDMPLKQTPNLQLDLQIPLTRKDPLHGLIYQSSERILHLPEIKPATHEFAGIAAGAAFPFMEGTIFAYHGSMAKYHLESSQSQQLTTIQDSNSTSKLLVNTFYSASQTVDFGWERTRIGYSTKLNSWSALLFEIQRHQISLQGQGLLQGRIDGLLQERLDLLEQERPFTYESDIFFSQWNASYSGQGWVARLAGKIGPLQWESTMGTRIPLRGNMEALQSTPLILDPLTAEPSATTLNAYTASFTDSLQEGAVNILTTSGEGNWAVQLPQTHAFYLQASPWVHFSYLWTRRPFSLELPENTNALDLRRQLQGSLAFSHTGAISFRSSFAQLTAGALQVEGSGKSLSPSLKDKWFPILQSQFWLGSRPGLDIRWEMLPYMRVFIGVHYAYQ